MVNLLKLNHFNFPLLGPYEYYTKPNTQMSSINLLFSYLPKYPPKYPSQSPIEYLLRYILRDNIIEDITKRVIYKDLKETLLSIL